MTEALTLDDIQADIAAALYLPVAELDESENVFESGLDSVRILTLVEKWRQSGVQVSFVELAERPTVGEWLALLGSRAQRGAGA